MNHMPRLLFFRWKYLKYMKRGIFTTCETKKSVSAVTNLGSHLGIDLLSKNNAGLSHMRLCNTLSVKNNKKERVDFKTAVMLNKFNKLKLELLLSNPACFNERSLLVIFKKMCVVYHNNKLDTKFILNLPLFVKSEEFVTFCTLLEKHLPKIMPDDLGILLNFEIFKIPIKSTLMRKILTLILDNLNNISYLNIMEIYLQLNSSYFQNSEESKRIQEACEVYFKNTIEDEICHSRHFEGMINFLNEKDLPFYVRKMIVERILEVLEFESFSSLTLQKFFHFAFERPFMQLFKDRILQTFKNYVILNVATSNQIKLIDVYESAVSRNESLYSEEICEIIVERSMSSRHYFTHSISAMEKLCLIGHFNEKLLHCSVDSIFGAQFSSLSPSVVLQMASILARTCYHERDTSIWEKVKEILQSYKPEESEFFGDFNKLIRWTEYLTFLGCDTRHLLNTIFSYANEEQYLKAKKNYECRNILNLHHFAEEYFSDGYTKLSKKSLELYLQNSIYPERVYSLSHVYEFFGGEDYVIRNCTNSHKHFIPMAIILDSDNKPLNLSSSKPVFVQNTTNRISTEIFKVFFNINNILKPPGSKVVAFMIYHDNQPFKFRNAPITSGTLRIFKKSVRNLGFDLILLPQRYLYFETNEKVKYLQSQIDEIIKKSESEKSSNINESVSKHQ